MKRYGITAENTEFVILCFEGPDVYSMAGGLGVRIANLSRALAGLGFRTHLFFIGDPHLEGEEVRVGGKLVLHRWCQWISEYYPEGVYQGEHEKLADFSASVPWFVVEHVARPAVGSGRMVVVLGEEWQTAEAMCRVNDLLCDRGMRDAGVMFWNANNTFSFDRIDWERLSSATTLTTVSRYMKHIMWGMGLNPLVIPNGIPRDLLGEVDETAARGMRKGLDVDLVLSKVARWDPDKRWHMALEATARLKARGLRPLLLARGGVEAHGREVLGNARSLGLNVRSARARGTGVADCLEALTGDGDADVLNLRFRCPQEFLRVVYRVSNAVLANSGHEPFGLVGLEAMAAGGIAFTGSTGEDYAIPFHNSIVLETSDPREIEAYVMFLRERPEEDERIRRSAKETARQFTWDRVVQNLLHKLEFQARVQGALTSPDGLCTPSATLNGLEQPDPMSGEAGAG